MRPNAKKIVLGMVYARGGEPVSVRDFIIAAKLFDIAANTVRVTLVRLSADGLIQASGRGAYRLGPAAENLAGYAADWHAAEAQLGEWSGDYLLVHAGHLGRSDRKVLKRRERAMHLCGLQPLERDLYLRPNNLKGGVANLRYRFQQLGAENELIVCEAQGFGGETDNQIASLWNGKALNSAYVETSQRIERWLKTAAELEPEVAARESWLLGSAAIRQLVYDPLLPEPMINSDLRHALYESVRRIDEVGKNIWDKVTLDRPVTTAVEAANYPEFDRGVAT